MNGVLPQDAFRSFHRFNIKIDDNGILAGAHEHAFECLVFTRIDFLMRHKGRNIDEIARPGFRGKLETVPPAHASLALDDINDAFKIAVVMGAGFGIGMDCYRSSPDFLRTSPRVVDGRRAVHARRLGRIGVQLVTRNDLDPVVAPVNLLMGVFVTVRMVMMLGVIVVL